MKLWGGRFVKETNTLVDDFNESISVDYRLYKQDIAGSIAHATMLGACGIIQPEEAAQICNGLKTILNEITNETVVFKKEAEDIHMNIEILLIEKIGDVGKKLHTGRSRNDQVALDTRMYVKDAINEIVILLKDLAELLITISEKNIHTIMPGYTHMQKAQPITLAHYLMAYFQMFVRDMQRFMDCYKRTDVMPLGSGALATTTYPINRRLVADILNFSEISQNSIDAVSDRDFCIEFISVTATCMMHFSRFCEEFVLWATNEFQFIQLDDSYSTGSSIMPQKKNPDVAELIRGKSGRVFGDLITILTIMKGLPLAYNKDMQEDKEALFDAKDTVAVCIKIFIGMLKTTYFDIEKMQESANGGFTNATDVADFLVKKGIPFREAHEIVGRLVLYCIQENKNLLDLSINEFQAYSVNFDESIYDAISLEVCINQRKLPGGPAEQSILDSIKQGREILHKINPGR